MKSINNVLAFIRRVAPGVSVALLAAAAGYAATGGTPQASLTLTNCDAQYCYTHNNTWSLTKEVTDVVQPTADSDGTVTWTVTATKDASAAPTFTVHGTITITNTGSGPATIGNIVVNLQKPNSPKKGSNAPYVSIAADIADATLGDQSTAANIVAAGSQENVATNAAWGTNNYAVSGAQGTFVETAGSGSLNFTDASNNTLFSIVPQPVIPVGQTVTLLYEASFATSVLPPAGTGMRVETIVTFGNSGLRGGSGATATNIDVNGNGVISADEANVRSVTCRSILAALPAVPAECNDSVTIIDDDVSVTGTLTTSSPSGFGQFPWTTNSTVSLQVSVDVIRGDGTLRTDPITGEPVLDPATGRQIIDFGTVCNSASLAGTSCGGQLITGYTSSVDPTTGGTIQTPTYASYTCNEAAEDSADACIGFSEDAPAPPSVLGRHCSYSQGAYGNKQGTTLANLPASGIVVGTGAYSMTFQPGSVVIHHAAKGTFGKQNYVAAYDETVTITAVQAIQNYLPAGGPSSALNTSLVNPTSSSSGNFGGQVLTLKLNVTLGGLAGIGGLIYNNPTDASDSLNGKTVAQILALAETALGGGALPAGYSYASLDQICEALNVSFDECADPTAWAVTHLSEPAAP